jgi:DNA-binding GntR family transcriptional regulator
MALERENAHFRHPGGVVTDPTNTHDKESPGTLASQATRRLRVALAAGSFRPGERLRMASLCRLLETGSSPVREALNRLAAEGLIDQHDQRGFWVPPVSLAELEELTSTRRWVNEIGLRESIAHGDALWEERVVVALHRLNQVPRVHELATEGVSPDWDRLHRAFHRALISGCGSRLLVDFAEQLLDRAARYRHLAVSVTARTRDVSGEHRAIAEAALARDGERAIALLNEHFSRTMMVAGSFAERVGETNPARRRSRRSPLVSLPEGSR